MAMVCPQCNSSYEQRWQCPQCETRLLFHDVRCSADRSTDRPIRWRQRSWGRIFLGLVLAQGLFYGLRHLVTAGLLAIQGREVVEQLWTTASGILLLQSVGMFALFVGAVFAGAGQRQALFLGAMVGAWNGVLSVLVLPGPAQSFTTIAVLGQPLLQAFAGTVGGWLGAALWKAPPSAIELEMPQPSRRALLRPNMDLFSGPVAWIRVGSGAVLAVAGTLMATLLLERILDLGNGSLGTADELQDRLITLEIKALALLFGGALAGSTTRNGPKQGLCVGLAATVILIGIEIHYVERWLPVAGLTAVSVLSLSFVGGWFGGQLFPPIVRGRRQRGLGNA